MSHRFIALACVLLLAGCRNVAPVDRINFVMPVSAEIRALQAGLLADVRAQHGDVEAMQREIDQRMKARTQRCGRAVIPTFEDDASLRASLDPTCFAEVDAAQRDWLRAQRLRRVLSAPPLRLLPSRITTIATPDGPGVAFASAAGVAITTQSRIFTAWSLLGGSILAKRESDERPGSVISPNGHVYVTYRGRECVLRRVDTGAELAVLHDVVGASFRFVGSVGGIARVLQDDGSTAVVFHDFIGGGRMKLHRLGPSDGVNVIAQDATHFQLTGKTLVQVELRIDATRVSSIKTHTAPIRTTWNTRLSSDGRSLLVPTQAGIELVDLVTKDLPVHRIELSPLVPHGVAPTADPDLLVVRGTFPGDVASRAYLYSIRHRTLALIEAPNTSGQIEWLPQIGHNVRMDGQRIEQIDGFVTGKPQPSSEAMQRELAAQRTRAEAESKRLAALVARQTREAMAQDRRADWNQDINATRRQRIEQSIRENHMDAEGAARLREWLDNVERNAK